MLRSLLLLAALLPEAHAAEEDRITIRVLDLELSVPSESRSLPDSLTVAFSAPDSLTVEVSVAEDGGGYGILLYDTTSTISSAHAWWSLCLEGHCPPIEVEVGSFTVEYEPAAGPVGTPEWKYVPVRRYL